MIQEILKFLETLPEPVIELIGGMIKDIASSPNPMAHEMTRKLRERADMQAESALLSKELPSK